MTELRILAAAEAEYLSAAQWYAERSATAADGFTTAVAAALRRILEQPEWGAACDAVHRQVIVRGYAFVIVYRAEDTPVPAARLLVVAVAHSSRRPDYWAERSPRG